MKGPPTEDANPLLDKIMGKEWLFPTDIRNVLSTQSKLATLSKPTVQFVDKQNNPNKGNHKIPIIDRKKFLQINATYQISLHENISHQASLLNIGANGGVCSSDMTVIAYTNRFINLYGFNNHEVNEFEIVSCAAVSTSQRGPVDNYSLVIFQKSMKEIEMLWKLTHRPNLFLAKSFTHN